METADLEVQQLFQKFITALIGNHIQERTTAQIRKEPVETRTAGQLILAVVIMDSGRIQQNRTIQSSTGCPGAP